jgi:SSS family solute:Na+ symporter
MGQAVDSNATLGNTDLTYSLGFWAGASLPLGLGLCLLITGLFFAAPMNRMGLLSLPDFYRIKYGRGVELASSVLMISASASCSPATWSRAASCRALPGHELHGRGAPDRRRRAQLHAHRGHVQRRLHGVNPDGDHRVGSAALLIWVGVTYGITIPEGMVPFDLGQLTDPAPGDTVNWATFVALVIGDIVAIPTSCSASSPRARRRPRGAPASSALPHGAGGALGRTDLRWPAADGPVLVCPPRRVRAGGLTILVLSAIIAASCSTANGAILGTASVAVRNFAGIEPRAEDKSVPDPLLRLVRITMLPVVGIAIFFAIAVPQTGILLTLAFDLMLAGLIVPFVLGHFWSRITTAAAAAAIGAGVVVRILLFALTPTMYGVENTVLYVPNDVFGPGFDGWPTFIAPLVSLVAFVAVALLSGRKDAPAADLPEPRTAPAETPQPATEG